MTKSELSLPSARHLILFGFSLFLLPSASGSLLQPNDNAPAQVHQPRWELPAALVEDVAVPLRRRRTALQVEAREEVARALDHERIQAYRRRDMDETEATRSSAVAADEAQPAADPLITPPPQLPPCLSGRNSLGRRQDNGQVQQLSQQLQQLSDQSRQVSQQSQQLSQQSQQLSQASQQLSQASQQLSQQSQQLSQSVQQLVQATSRLGQELQSAQDLARQNNDRANQAQAQASQASAAADAATQSANSAVQIASSSILSSASAAIASSLASATSSAAASASSVLDAARSSASSIVAQAASQVQAARADATLARADASTQIEQAQGAAVSVTQAALAVVGTFIGSSLLSILAFYLILRYRQNKQDKLGSEKKRPEISYPRSFRKEASGLGDAYGSTDGLVGGGGGAYGYPADVKEPVMSGGGVSDRYALRRSSSNYGETTVVGEPPAAKFSLFPKSNVGSPVVVEPGEVHRKSVTVPSLEKWLQAGTVSPFGTPGGKQTGPSEPARTSQWPLDGTTRRGVGLGAATNSSGKGPVMRPGDRLPFRDR